LEQTSGSIIKFSKVMYKMKKIVTLFTLLGIISLNVSANENPVNSWSFEVDTGKSSIEIGSSEFDAKGNATSYGLSIGYSLNEKLLIKGGYKNFGSTSFDAVVCTRVVNGLPWCPEVSGKIKATGFFSSIEGKASLSASYTLNGELGFVNWSADAEMLGQSSKIDDGTDLFYGVALGTTWGETDVNFGYRAWSLSDVDISEMYISFNF